MLSLLARRLLLSLPTLAGVLVVVFLLLYVCLIGSGGRGDVFALAGFAIIVI